MPFISGLTQLRSLSIVGMAKNTGKTECLNYVLRRLWEEYPQVSLALTSIGIDGERRDQVTQPINLRFVYTPVLSLLRPKSSIVISW